jgi:hypothetical protein
LTSAGAKVQLRTALTAAAVIDFVPGTTVYTSATLPRWSSQTSSTTCARPPRVSECGHDGATRRTTRGPASWTPQTVTRGRCGRSEVGISLRACTTTAKHRVSARLLYTCQFRQSNASAPQRRARDAKCVTHPDNAAGHTRRRKLDGALPGLAVLAEQQTQSYRMLKILTTSGVSNHAARRRGAERVNPGIPGAVSVHLIIPGPK